MVLLNGKMVATIKTDELKNRIQKLGFSPTLGIIQVGDLFESNKYIQNKIKKADEIGIKTIYKKFDSNINEKDLIFETKKLNDEVDGLIVQLPLPKIFNEQLILDCVDLEKDIDGLSTKNMENFYNESGKCFIPATAKAVLMLLKHYQVPLNDKNIIVIGESNLAGKPIKKLLSKYTTNIESRNKQTGLLGIEKADVLIVAAGKANLINSSHIKEGITIVDVGINTLKDKSIVGDVNYNSVINKVKFISPTPGGVGPLTIIALLENLVEKFE